MPEISDASIRKNTGQGLNAWVALINDGPGPQAGHAAIANWLVQEYGIDEWWAQSITVGYERIAGLRLPGQMKDGTFTVSRTKTLDLDAHESPEVLPDRRSDRNRIRDAPAAN